MDSNFLMLEHIIYHFHIEINHTSLMLPQKYLKIHLLHSERLKIEIYIRANEEATICITRRVGKTKVEIRENNRETWNVYPNCLSFLNCGVYLWQMLSVFVPLFFSPNAVKKRACTVSFNMVIRYHSKTNYHFSLLLSRCPAETCFQLALFHRKPWRPHVWHGPANVHQIGEWGVHILCMWEKLSTYSSTT